MTSSRRNENSQPQAGKRDRRKGNLNERRSFLSKRRAEKNVPKRHRGKQVERKRHRRKQGERKKGAALAQR